jgi:hypothetical protein
MVKSIEKRLSENGKRHKTKQKKVVKWTVDDFYKRLEKSVDNFEEGFNKKDSIKSIPTTIQDLAYFKKQVLTIKEKRFRKVFLRLLDVIEKRFSEK